MKMIIRAPGVLYGTGTGNDAFLRFSRMRRTVDRDWTIDIAGDEAEAQNAAGTWVPVKYICTIDVRTFAVNDVSMKVAAGSLTEPIKRIRKEQMR